MGDFDGQNKNYDDILLVTVNIKVASMYTKLHVQKPKKRKMRRIMSKKANKSEKQKLKLPTIEKWLRIWSILFGQLF